MGEPRPLTGARCLGKLGERSRVSIVRKVRTAYRVEWEYDGHRVDPGCEEDGYYQSVEPERRVRVRSFYTVTAAYRWAALRLIFTKRDKLATRIGDKGYPEGCTLCDELAAQGRYLGHGEYDDAELCRYHDSADMERLRDRLARWLRWRDSKAAL